MAWPNRPLLPHPGHWLAGSRKLSFLFSGLHHETGMIQMKTGLLILSPSVWCSVPPAFCMIIPLLSSDLGVSVTFSENTSLTTYRNLSPLVFCHTTLPVGVMVPVNHIILYIPFFSFAEKQRPGLFLHLYPHPLEHCLACSRCRTHTHTRARVCTAYKGNL